MNKVFNIFLPSAAQLCIFVAWRCSHPIFQLIHLSIEVGLLRHCQTFLFCICLLSLLAAAVVLRELNGHELSSLMSQMKIVVGD